MHIINPMKHALSIAVLISLIAGNLQAAVFTVINTNDTGAGSLRNAITSLAAGANTIQFDIPTSDPGYNATNNTWTIAPATDLPNIAFPVTITGYTFGGAVHNTATPNTLAQGDNAVLQIILNGALAPTDAATTGNGLHFVAGSDGSIVRGLIINQWLLNGILIDGSSSDSGINNIQINGNFIGTNSTGTAVVANRTGVGISGATNPITNTIIGTPARADRNIIAGSFGYFILDSYSIRGACICSNNSISDGNTGTLIQNNYIGTNASGIAALGTSQCGVMFISEFGALIGGTLATQRNIISGHDIYGVNLTQIAPLTFVVANGCTNCLIQGNYIGTDVTGTLPIGNSNAGIELDSASVGNTIGGVVAGAGNLISGNGNGIQIGQLVMPGNITNLVQGNLIGTDVSGTKALINTRWGILINDNQNTIGGTTTLTRNIISGNTFGGILMHSADANIAEGNYIGTDTTGTKAIGNAGPGIQLGIAGDQLAATNNIIGA